METSNINNIILEFINKMDYLNNKHVLGCFFYGSFVTGFNNNDSDIDLHIIFDDSNPKHLIRENDNINGRRIEYFEKPIESKETIEDEEEPKRLVKKPSNGKGNK